MASNSPKLFPWRIFYRVALVQSLLILLALASSGLVARQLLKHQFILQFESRLKDALLIGSQSLGEHPNAGFCHENFQHTVIRFSLIRADGSVLCDSQVSVAGIENQSA